MLADPGDTTADVAGAQGQQHVAGPQAIIEPATDRVRALQHIHFRETPLRHGCGYKSTVDARDRVFAGGVDR